MVLLEGDYSRVSVAALLALLERGAIVAPLAPGALVESERLVAQCGASAVLRGERLERTQHRSDHALYEDLRRRSAPGLVIKAAAPLAFAVSLERGGVMVSTLLLIAFSALAAGALCLLARSR